MGGHLFDYVDQLSYHVFLYIHFPYSYTRIDPKIDIRPKRLIADLKNIE